MLRGNNKVWKEMIAVTSENLRIPERRVDIPIVDNKEFRMNLIERIEAVTLKIIEQISTGQSPQLSYPSGRNITTESSEEDGSLGCSSDFRHDTMSDTYSFDSTEIEESEEQDVELFENSKKTTVNFVVKRSKDKFVLMILIMSKVHHLLLTNTTKTKRSFYYDLKNEITASLVPDQKFVDRALNSVANLLECAPWDLRLVATAKGLVAGNMIITLHDNQVIDCRVPGGVQIPLITSNVTAIRTKAEFVLIIEKDAVFQKLLEENCPRILNCILVTGKGYPDVATRMLVKTLSEKINLSVYIVVDADPFGVDIMLIYRFGSSNLYKESESLACPNALWLGIHPSELIYLKVKTIPLTEADLAKLKSIEARTYINETISSELSVLRKGKAEIEAVAVLKNFFTATYLPNKIDSQNYI